MQQPRNPFLVLEIHKQYLAGKSQKSLAIKFRVTEKTIKIWLEPLKEKIKKNQDNIAELNKRLDILLKDKNSKPKDIRDLIRAINELEKIWFNKRIKN